MTRAVDELIASGVTGVVAASLSADCGSLPSVVVGGETGAVQTERVTADTIFDLASVTKLFTATCAFMLQEAHALSLNDALGRYFPRASAADATVRDLLSHVSGLPPSSGLWREVSDPEDARQRLLTELPVAAPQTRHLYSCVGYATLGLVIEKVMGVTLDEAVHTLVAAPLGMESLSYRRPAVGSEGGLIAATEIRGEDDPCRPGLCHGQVHDELAWSLGGVAGNAGLFSTASDLLKFGRVLAHKGLDREGRGLLAESSIVEMLNAAPIGPESGEYRQGLGPRLGMRSLTGSDRVSLVGHTGFTGTAVISDIESGRTAVVLTNGIFPHRRLSPVAPLLRPLVRELLELKDADAATPRR